MIRRHFILGLALCFGLMLFSQPSPVLAAAETFEEYEVKAAFLYQFTKFIEWPEEKSAKPLNLCVLKNDPISAAIGKIESSAADSVRVHRLQKDEAIDQCHLLFVSAFRKDYLDDYIRESKAEPLVTISEVQGFVKAGGIINFVQEDHKIRFEINQRQAEAKGIKISSKLLNLASEVIKS